MKRIRPTILRGLGIAVILISPLVLQPRTSAHASDRVPVEQLFEAYRRVASLGLEQILLYVFSDLETLGRLDQLAEGEELRLDFDEDGSTDAVAWKEASTRVIAVSAVGGPLTDDPRRNRADVCYLADQGGDGIPNRVVEYLDTDGNGRPDRQTIYEITSGELSAPGIGLFVYIDLDGDNRFLETTDYSYHSARNMWGSDFNGNICLIAGYRDEVSGSWHSAYENPFCFYDDDGDGFSDQAVRYAGEDLRLETIRWSFDADGDAPRTGTHDYDFSLTATGPVVAPGVMADSLMLRDGNPIRFVSWRHARDLARWTLWRSVLLAWDENDRNTDASPDPEAPERWEGVIAEPFRGFPRVGGPTCGLINKRYEIDRDGSGRMRVYYSGVDRRLHLSGAEEGELLVALPTDPPLRGKLSMTDSDRNGTFDRWTYSSGNGSMPPKSIEVTDEMVVGLSLETGSLRRFWATEVLKARDDAERLVEDSAGSGNRVDSVRQDWASMTRTLSGSWSSHASQSLELDRLLQDRILWDAGAGLFADREDRPEQQRSEPFTVSDCTPPLVLAIDRITGSLEAPIEAATLLELRSGDTRIPGQVEDWDGDGEFDHLYFSTCPAETAELLIDPPSRLPRREQTRIDPWFANGIAIESLHGGYTFIDGRIGCLVKRQDRLVLRGNPGQLPRSDRWGVTVSFVGAEPGLAGLHVRQGDHWISGLEENGGAALRVIKEGPLRAVVEILTSIGGYEIERTWSLSGDRSSLDEEIRVRGEDRVTLGLTLPMLDASGHIPDLGGFYSYGIPVTGADAIGLAGAILSPVEIAPTKIDGRPALQVTVEPGERLRLVWTSGGTIVGDSTATRWESRARERITGLRLRGPIYP